MSKVASINLKKCSHFFYVKRKLLYVLKHRRCLYTHALEASLCRPILPPPPDLFHLFTEIYSVANCSDLLQCFT